MKKSQKQAIAIGAGLATAAAAAAGVYFLTGKNAKNRKKVAKWATDLKHDVVKELDKAGKTSKAGYNKLVDQVAKNYAGLKSINSKEVMDLASELKSHWDTISTELGAVSATVKKAVPKAKKAVAKKATVKSVKKVVAKAKKAVAKKASKARR